MIRKIKCYIFCLFLILELAFFRIYAEGTKEIMPLSNIQGSIVIDKYRNDFGFYDASPEYRINIAIASTSERIRFGFGEVFQSGWSTYSGDMEFRIKDPSGNIVYGPFYVPIAGQTGYIESYSQAMAGPVPGGYPWLELVPGATGDYYIEFYYPPGSWNSDEYLHAFRFFDITVMDGTGRPASGRIWSKAWQFYCLHVETPPTYHRYYGTMMILSDDSIVTKVNFNGIVGGAFTVSSNATGCINSGDIKADRKSIIGFHTYPKYKIFVNDPDSLLFPTAKVNTGILLPVLITTDCTTGSADFGIRVVKDGIVEILIELNPSPGADPEDVKLVAAVLANPGPGGYNLVHWDGHDNHGNPVDGGKALLATVNCLNGLTHMPLYDIEYNDNGFIVSQVRPAGSQIKIFWDDSQISGGTVDTISGCITGSGCHTWNDTVGDVNSVNSWWYVERDAVPPVPFSLHRLPGSAGNILGPELVCVLSGAMQYSIPRIRDAERYIWGYSGSGVIIGGGDSVVYLTFTSSATSGTLSVYGHDSQCGDGPVSTLDLTITNDTVPSVILVVTPNVCQSTGDFPLTGGTPTGGNYSVDGINTETVDTDYDSLGPHLVTYTYTLPGGCTGSDSSMIVLKNCQDSIIPVYFPNAFTPDGNGLNDLFRPVGPPNITFTTFRLLVFSRYGQMTFQTGDPLIGWDGTLNGELCPEGVYAWSAVFEIPEHRGVKIAAKGTVTLIR